MAVQRAREFRISYPQGGTCFEPDDSWLDIIPAWEDVEIEVPMPTGIHLPFSVTPEVVRAVARASLTAVLTQVPPEESPDETLGRMIDRIAALEEYCGFLESEISALKGELRVQHKTVTITSLPSAPYILSRPLLLNVEIRPTEVLAEYVEVGIYGVGDSEQEAIRDFCQYLIEYYECLRDERNNLARETQEHWDILCELVIDRSVASVDAR